MTIIIEVDEYFRKGFQDGIHDVFIEKIFMNKKQDLIIEFANINNSVKIKGRITERYLEFLRHVAKIGGIKLAEGDPLNISDLKYKYYHIQVVSGKVRKIFPDYITEDQIYPPEDTIEIEENFEEEEEDKSPEPTEDTEYKDEYFLKGFGYAGFVSNYWFLCFDAWPEDDRKKKTNPHINDINLLVLFFDYNEKAKEYKMRFVTKRFRNYLGLNRGISHLELYELVDMVEHSWPGWNGIPVKVNLDMIEARGEVEFEFNFKEQIYIGKFGECFTNIYLQRKIPAKNLTQEAFEKYVPDGYSFRAVAIDDGYFPDF